MAVVSLTFPDSSVRSYPAGITAAQVAESIAPSLAKRAISAHLDGRHWDLQWPIDHDGAITLNTMKDDGPALELVRHDLAHIMARAVQDLWPDVKVTIGPVIDNGWYYDFDRAEPFTPEDLGAIEHRMRQIISARDPVRTELWPRDRAIAHYRDRGEPYKVELVRTSACTGTGPGRTSAAARIFNTRARSPPTASSSCRSPAPTGAATAATPCSSASMARRS
jgi:threonyl-tRNA synthetase